MLQELEEDMEKVKKIMYEQNINMKISKKNSKRNSAIEKYSNYSEKKKNY